LTITDADNDIFASLKPQSKDIKVRFFLMQATKTIEIVALLRNEKPDCNKLGTNYKFKQYEQQEIKINSILLGTPLLKTQKMTRYPKNVGGHCPFGHPLQVDNAYIHL